MVANKCKYVQQTTQWHRNDKILENLFQRNYNSLIYDGKSSFVTKFLIKWLYQWSLYQEKITSVIGNFNPHAH